MVEIHYDKQNKKYYLTVNGGYVIAYVSDLAWAKLMQSALNEVAIKFNEEV